MGARLYALANCFKGFILPCFIHRCFDNLLDLLYFSRYVKIAVIKIDSFHASPKLIEE